MPPLSSDDLSGRIMDVLLIDDKLLTKAVCLYAVKNCLADLAADLADGLAENISRSGSGNDEAGAGNDYEKRIVEKTAELIKNNPDLIGLGNDGGKK